MRAIVWGAEDAAKLHGVPDLEVEFLVKVSVQDLRLRSVAEVSIQSSRLN